MNIPGFCGEADPGVPRKTTWDEFPMRIKMWRGLAENRLMMAVSIKSQHCIVPESAVGAEKHDEAPKFERCCWFVVGLEWRRACACLPNLYMGDRS
jgi:hypothetical protein